MFIGLYFPANNNCYAYTTQDACLTKPSLILPDDTMCGWDGATCSLKAPPTDFAFVVTVAIVTTLISLPIDVSFIVALFMVCARRPVMEKIGLDSFQFLGTEVKSCT
jgi:hypothetical protein